jgi:HPr kinase/phosphorylase
MKIKVKKLKVKELYEKHSEELGLKLIAGEAGMRRLIHLPEIERPGLSLTGYMKGFDQKRILIFGKGETDYLKALPVQKRLATLGMILTPRTPLIISAHSLRPIPEMMQQCEEQEIPLLKSHYPSMHLMSRLLILLSDELAPSLSCHGSLVEIFGIGVLIQGEAAVGKSEAALGLIKRGHRLIADDIVKIKRREGGYLEGFGIGMSRHHMEIKGLGIINIAQHYGAMGVQEKKSLDIVVKLEVWDDSYSFDREGVKQNRVSILGVDIPFHTLLVKPGRDVVLLLETIALNHRCGKS